MNNDLASSSAADRDLPSTTESSTYPIADSSPSQSSQQNAQSPAQKRAQAQTKKKYEFVSGMMTNLDMLIYAELSIVYYMEYKLFYNLDRRGLSDMISR
jgi:hypothetical protein